MISTGTSFGSRVTSHVSRFLVWWKAVRPYAYPASIMPVAVGVAFAWSQGIAIHWGWALITLIGVVAAHTGGNLINDYEDFRRGVDRPGTLGGNGLLVDGTLTPRAILVAALIAFAIAGIVAIPLVMHVGAELLWLVALGLLAGAEYVLPPLGLKYRALGDLTVFLAFGVGITVGSYSVQAVELSLAAAPVAVPMGLLVAAILHANNIRDVEDDTAVAVRTFAARIGPVRARMFFLLLIAGAYAMTLGLVVGHVVVPGAALVILTLPLAISIVREVWCGRAHDRRLAEAVPRTAQLNLAFGGALVGGIVIWTAFA